VVVEQSFDFARIWFKRQCLMLVIVGEEFGSYGFEEQIKIRDSLRKAAVDSGFFGPVIPIWNDGTDRLACLAPLRWKRFVAEISPETVAELVCKSPLLVHWDLPCAA
jgi:hypothetical protein